MKKITLLLSLIAWTAPVAASTLPQADFNGLHLGLGSSPGISLELALTEHLALGGAAALPLFFGAFGFTRYEGHLSYRFLKQEQVDVSLLLGVFGDLNSSGRTELDLSPLGLALGLGITWHLSPELSVRANIVPGIGFPKSTGWGLFPPAGGVEVGYHPVPSLEVTAGFNGNGDILGFNFRF